MTNDEKIVAVVLLLGFVVSTVGLTIALGVGWAALWAGLLLIAGALKFDSR
jgi:hypothetical protein